MNKLALQEIDFYRLRDEVAGYCITEESRQTFLQREPLTDSKKIEQLKNLSREWSVFLSASCKNPVTFWEPVEKLMEIIRAHGTSLSLEQVKALGQFVLSVKSVKQAVEIHADELELKLLAEQTALLPDMSETEKLIFHIITPDGQIRDLPEITAIRKQIAALNAKIKKIFQQYTSDQKLASVLESNVPVLRNGRQALAVKASLQNRINGIIIEVSQTAQTVYIEPEEVVRCDNELIQKENELIQVINKILQELTTNLQPSIPLFKQAIPVMKLMDMTIAAARWGLEHNCCYAVPAVGEPPLVLKARHPLLGDKAVPIDFYFIEGKRVLIITGPNTGGKTVSLKTFALLSMLNQAGLPVPAADGTRLPVFTDIFADIGDSQSLDMSLSTFSGHMKNIAQAVKGAGKSTLVLLDELGSGTDPQEGTALAMSVLDTLIEKQAFVLVTTHMGILKNYGYTNPGCINASVEFDTSTLSPSYRLVMGIPGESHAIAIARKSGLPQKIVDSAKKYIATEQADVSSLIKGLNKKHSELDRLQHRARVLEQELESKALHGMTEFEDDMFTNYFTDKLVTCELDNTVTSLPFGAFTHNLSLRRLDTYATDLGDYSFSNYISTNSPRQRVFIFQPTGDYTVETTTSGGDVTRNYTKYSNGTLRPTANMNFGEYSFYNLSNAVIILNTSGRINCAANAFSRVNNCTIICYSSEAIRGNESFVSFSTGINNTLLVSDTAYNEYRNADSLEIDVPASLRGNNAPQTFSNENVASILNNLEN